MTSRSRPQQQHYRWLSAAEPILGRRIYIAGTRSTNAGEGAIITSMGTVNSPHYIHAAHFRSNSDLEILLVCDILISDNPSTLIDQQVTDTHITGLTGQNVGYVPGSVNTRIPINRLIDRAQTFYKLFTYNGSVSNRILSATLEVSMRSTR